MTTPEPMPVTFPLERTYLFDPPPPLGGLREQRPVCRLRYSDGSLGWLVTSYALARAVLTDSRFSMSMTEPHLRDVVGAPAVREARHGALADAMSSGAFLFMDPPEHTKFRKLLASHFAVRRVREHRPLIEQFVTDRLDAIEQAGPPVDLVKMFASPISIFTQCALLGVPPTYGELLQHMRTILEDPQASVNVLVEAGRDVREELWRVIEQKRAEPADDVVGHLVARGELTNDEILSVVTFLFGAGQGTIKNTIGLGAFVLLCHPEWLAALYDDPAGIDTAVEELLRYLTTVLAGFTRTAREDLELGGVLIKAGESVTASLSAANRDPQKFHDPDRLDFGRNTAGHLAFGQGVHMCLGQHLARLEMQVALGGLLRRFPTLRLAVPVEDIPLDSGEKIDYRVEQLAVSW
jgi:cytochrome P450